MRKSVTVVLVIVVALLFSGYTSMWFYVADQIKKDILTISEHSKKNSGVSVHFDNIDVSGYPANVRVVLKKFKISSGDIDIDFGNTNISSNIFANVFKIHPDKMISVQRLNKEKVEIDFDKQASLKLKFAASPIFDNKHNKVSDFLEKLRYVSYQHNGYSMKTIDPNTKAAVLTYRSNFNNFILNIADHGAKKVFDIDSKNESQILDNTGAPTKVDVASIINMDIENDKENGKAIYKQFNLHVKKFSVNIGDSSLVAFGDFVSEKDAILPVGKLDVEITQLDNLLNNFVKVGFLQKSDTIKEVIIKVANAPIAVPTLPVVPAPQDGKKADANPPSVTAGALAIEQKPAAPAPVSLIKFQIKHEKDGNLMFGSVSLAELMGMLYTK